MKTKKIHQKVGFTAAEIITVVAIIAILALIVLPKYWKRMEESKVTAAKSEMKELANVEALVFAETGYYVRLRDLFQVQSSPYATVTVWNFDDWKASAQKWNPDSGFTERKVLGERWKGPYIQYQPKKFHETTYEPLDPWGNPYWFFGPVTVSETDTTYSPTCRIWSSGANYVFDSKLPWGPPEKDDIVFEF